MLSEHEQDALQIILNNEVLLGAIRKVFDMNIEANRPQIGLEDNQLLGEKYRAFQLAKGYIEIGFKILLSFKKGEKEKVVLNRAR